MFESKGHEFESKERMKNGRAGIFVPAFFVAGGWRDLQRNGVAPDGQVLITA